jgi:hypothetical protein
MSVTTILQRDVTKSLCPVEVGEARLCSIVVREATFVFYHGWRSNVCLLSWLENQHLCSIEAGEATFVFYRGWRSNICVLSLLEKQRLCSIVVGEATFVLDIFTLFSDYLWISTCLSDEFL